MTALSAPILFNNSTGSDTAASGSGPATALFGTGAATANTAVVTLTVDAPNLSGVSAGMLMWVDSSSGRQFSVIASVDNTAKTVTCDDTYTQTEGSRNWGIGGKRATLDNANSRKLLDNAAGDGDAYGGWILEFESGHTDTITSNIRIRRSGSSTLGPIIIRGAPGAATRPILTANFNGVMFFSGPGNGHQFEGFTALNSNATKTASIFLQNASGGNYAVVRNMIIGSSANKFWKGVVSSNVGWRIEGSVIQDCASDGITLSAGSCVLTENRIINNGGSGVVESGSGVPNIYTSNIVAGNTGDGLNITNSTAGIAGSLVIDGNIIHDNDGDGIELSGTAIRLFSLAGVIRNIITENGGYGINGSSMTDALADFYGTRFDHNAFYSNTSGEINGISNGDNDITLSADPYVDAASGDFNLNTDAGGGQLLRDAVLTLPG